MLDFYKYWYAENIYSISSKRVFVAVRNGCVGKKSGGEEGDGKENGRGEGMGREGEGRGGG